MVAIIQAYFLCGAYKKEFQLRILRLQGVKISVDWAFMCIIFTTDLTAWCIFFCLHIFEKGFHFILKYQGTWDFYNIRKLDIFQCSLIAWLFLKYIFLNSFRSKTNVRCKKKFPGTLHNAVIRSGNRPALLITYQSYLGCRDLITRWDCDN